MIYFAEKRKRKNVSETRPDIDQRIRALSQGPEKDNKQIQNQISAKIHSVYYTFIRNNDILMS